MGLQNTAGTDSFFSGLNETSENCQVFQEDIIVSHFPPILPKFSCMCYLKTKFACGLLYLQIKLGGREGEGKKGITFCLLYSQQALRPAKILLCITFTQSHKRTD